MGILVEPFATPFLGRALAELLLLAVIAGPVSVFVLLRKQSFVADAITHTVFPGVVLGFVLAGADGILPGALIAALVTAIALTLLGGTLTGDAATAVVLTAMFSIGVVIVSRRSSYAGDLTAFLFGRILTVSPRQLAETAVLAVIVLVLLAAGARAFVLRAFDPAGARAAGFRVPLLDLWLNLLIALVVVAAVQAVGTILVVALLIVPAAAGRLLTDRLPLIALAGTLLTAVAGYLGLLASWIASIEYDLRLTSASAVVLVLLLGYLAAAATRLRPGVAR